LSTEKRHGFCPGAADHILWQQEYQASAAGSGTMPHQDKIAMKAILLTQEGHGDMENAARFPHPHTPGGDYGQMSNRALH